MLLSGGVKCNALGGGVAGLKRNRYELVVVGGGVAGLTAAWHAAMRGLSVAVVEPALTPGGQIATVGRIEGMPVAAMSGSEFAISLLAEARAAGARLLAEEITEVEPAHGGFLLRHDERFTLAHTVLLATGGAPRRLDVEGGAEFEGRGIAHCASCDGPLCRDRDVVVVGGGDAALQEALLLSGHARSVTVVVRGRPRARKSYLDRAGMRPNLHFAWDSTVVAIRGRAGVETVRLRHADGGERDVACFAVFPKIGCTINSGVAGHLVRREQTGAICTDALLETHTRGLFAAGAVRDTFGGDLIDAAAEGAQVARIVAARKRQPDQLRTEETSHDT